MLDRLWNFHNGFWFYPLFIIWFFNPHLDKTNWKQGHPQYIEVFGSWSTNTPGEVYKREKELVKKNKKDYQKLLTKAKRSDNICKHSRGGTRWGWKKEALAGLKKSEKKLEKSLKKVLTKGYRCGILFELSKKRTAIGP